MAISNFINSCPGRKKAKVRVPHIVEDIRFYFDFNDASEGMHFKHALRELNIKYTFQESPISRVKLVDMDINIKCKAEAYLVLRDVLSSHCNTRMYFTSSKSGNDFTILQEVTRM